MTINTESLNQLLNVLVQLMIVVIPILLSWIIRNYVKSSNAERGTAAIVRLANAGIDFVENLDNTGSLNLPPDYKKGVYKLKLATEFLEGELQRAGIKMTTEEAQQWISSEFQKRVGEVRPVKDIAALTSESAGLVLDLEKRGVLQHPAEVERQEYLTELIADLVQAKLATKNWNNVPRDELVTAARSELLTRFGGRSSPRRSARSFGHPGARGSRFRSEAENRGSTVRATRYERRGCGTGRCHRMAADRGCQARDGREFHADRASCDECIASPDTIEKQRGSCSCLLGLESSDKEGHWGTAQ